MFNLITLAAAATYSLQCMNHFFQDIYQLVDYCLWEAEVASSSLAILIGPVL